VKKALIIAALALAISMSIIAGTLSMYTVTIDNLAHGSVVAKEFVLEPGETNTFAEDVKIAPGETVQWEFSVKNHDDGIVSETAMELEFTVVIEAADEKEAIDLLEIAVIDEGGEELGKETGTGVIKLSDEFGLDENGQEKTYKISITWPLDASDSIDYAGADYGTAVKVAVTGTQK